MFLFFQDYFNSAMKLPKVLKAFVFVVFVFAAKNHLSAQHCRWDAAEILVFEIKANNSDTVSLDGLKVTITDSAGNPIFYPYFFRGEEIRNPFHVFQNQIDSACNTRKVERTIDVRCFWFAKNNYVALGNWYVFALPQMQVHIEDVDGEKNGGFFENKTVPLDTSFVFPLCHRYSKWESAVGREFVKDYRPMPIVLDKRSRE